METYMRRFWLCVAYVPALATLLMEGVLQRKEPKGQWLAREFKVFKRYTRDAWTGNLQDWGG